MTTALNPMIRPANEASQRVWNASGPDYDHISRQIAEGIEHCVERLDPNPGERILDVATGTGWTARRMHARGAAVTGVVRDMFEVARPYRPTPTADRPSPFQWGDEDRLHELFGASFQIATETATCYYRAPSAEAAWDAFYRGYGPVSSTADGLDPARAARFRADFIELHDRYRTDLGILVPRTYRICAGTRMA